MALLVILTASACQGPVSALDPAGQGAADIAWITWVMIAGTLFFMALMTGLWLHAVYRRSDRPLKLSNTTVLVGGGLVLPLVVITLLLVYGIRSGHSMLPIGAPDLEIRVTAYQWFWEFEYSDDQGRSLTLVDELHLPLGQRIDFHIDTADVIHSFWIPALGGKMDAIPGRTNTLRLVPTRAGQFGGQCAEFCGARHAHMHFAVTVHEPEDFQRWLDTAFEDAP
ncbi:MAG: cytochrome c oxidase subunit II [Wenzhouxiangella sp.]|nr:MAG: cytochrome c oxidase subunit II [Wenzhouxiangella sp.]